MVKALLIQEYDTLTSLNKAITPNNLRLIGKQWGNEVLEVSRVLKTFCSYTGYQGYKRLNRYFPSNSFNKFLPAFWYLTFIYY